MPTFDPRRAVAALVAVCLLLAALPAAAAPEPAPADPRADLLLLQALTAWLGALWPGSVPLARPAPAAEASHGGATDEPPLGSEAGSDDEPTAQPQLGPDADPHG